MMLIPCPLCGPRALNEFAFERPLETVAPLSDPPEALMQRLYTRTNPRGPSLELWRHLHGCRAFLALDRNSLTHEIMDARLFEGLR
jgi:sarcosine oxidase subunit delta